MKKHCQYTRSLKKTFFVEHPSNCQDSGYKTPQARQYRWLRWYWVLSAGHRYNFQSFSYTRSILSAGYSLHCSHFFIPGCAGGMAKKKSHSGSRLQTWVRDYLEVNASWLMVLEHSRQIRAHSWKLSPYCSSHTSAHSSQIPTHRRAKLLMFGE